MQSNLCPRLPGSDIGSEYEQVNSDDLNSDIEDDSVAITLEPREGNYLNIANDGVENGRMIARFPTQNSGTVTATLRCERGGREQRRILAYRVHKRNRQC